MENSLGPSSTESNNRKSIAFDNDSFDFCFTLSLLDHKIKSQKKILIRLGVSC